MQNGAYAKLTANSHSSPVIINRLLSCSPSCLTLHLIESSAVPHQGGGSAQTRWQFTVTKRTTVMLPWGPQYSNAWWGLFTTFMFVTHHTGIQGSRGEKSLCKSTKRDRWAFIHDSLWRNAIIIFFFIMIRVSPTIPLRDSTQPITSSNTKSCKRVGLSCSWHFLI